jgi:hypothetical protein
VHVTHLALPSETDSRRLILDRGRPATATAGRGEPAPLAGNPAPA